jgi:hypothetical protein
VVFVTKLGCLIHIITLILSIKAGNTDLSKKKSKANSKGGMDGIEEDACMHAYHPW